MKDDVKNFIINKNSFLIYGIDQGYNIDIFNELVEELESKHSEIFYFNMLNSSINPKFNLEVHRVAKGLNLFEFFKEKKISQEHFDRYIKDICNCLHAELFDTKVDGQTYLTNLLEDVYHSELADTFNIDELIELLGDIINAPKSRIGKDFFDTLDQIDGLKSKYSEDYFTDPAFDKLARKARLQLEHYLLDYPGNRSYSDVVLKWSNYDLGIKYFAKLLERMSIPVLHKFTDEPKTLPSKINYFQIDHYTMRCNYLDMALSSIVRKLKIYNSQNRPLVIINGKQKDLFKSVSMDIEELFNQCNVCFIINNGEDLDPRVNFFVDAKIYHDKHKNLSLGNTGTEKRINNDYIIHYN